jgi:hypothetical protein
MDINEREKLLQKRLDKINSLENEIKERERALLSREKAKKQVLLRLAPSLWDQIAVWAQDDFRSINAQIEFLLSEAVKHRFSDKKNK